MPKDVLDVRGVLQFYEYGVEDYPSPSQAVRYEREPLGLQPAHEIISLSDYRRRHALYRMDRGLQVSNSGLSCVFRINMCLCMFGYRWAETLLVAALLPETVPNLASVLSETLCQHLGQF